MAASVRPVVEALEERRLLAITFADFGTQTTAEGAGVTFSGKWYADEGYAGPHELRLDWGDGTPLDYDSGTSPDPDDGYRVYLDPYHRYTRPGVYAPRLTVWDQADPTHRAELTFGVTVLAAPPTVTVGATASYVRTGAAVTLAPVVADPGGNHVSAWDVDWGDGQTSHYDTPDYRHKVVATVGYGGAAPAAGGLTTPTSIQKTDETGAAIPEFSYALSAGGAQVVGGADTWTRGGSAAAGDVTVTRQTAGAAGTLATRTLLNAAGLVTERDVTLAGVGGGGPPSSTAATVYAYLAQPGNYGDRFSNGAPRWGKVTNVTYPDGSWEGFAYDDPRGWVTARTTPAGGGTEQTFGYAEPDGSTAPQAVRPWYLFERPRSVVTRTQGVETGRAYMTQGEGSTTVRAAATPGATWADSAARETVIQSLGTSPAGPLYQVTTPAGTFAARNAGNNTVETSSTGPNGLARSYTRTTFNAFGVVTAVESRQSDVVAGLDVLLGKYASTASVFGFGRIATMTDELTGRRTTYEDAQHAQGWFGPSQVVGEDGTVTALAYTPWGAVSNRATYGVTTAYGYDAAGDVLTRTDSSGTNVVSVAARFDALGRPVYARDAAGRETSTQYAVDAVAGRVTATTTLPDGQNTVVATSYLDGAPAGLSGTAAYPETYTRGVDAQKGYWEQSASGPGGANWSRTYFDALGRAYRTERAGPNGNTMVATVDAFDALDRPTRQTDFDGTVTLTQYDETRGFAAASILDVNRNGVYDPGADRATSRRLSLTYHDESNANGTPRYYWAETLTAHGGPAPYTPDTVGTTETSADGLKTIRTAGGGLRTTSVYAFGGGPGQGTLTVTRPDGTRSVESYDQGLLRTSAELGVSGDTPVTQVSYQYDAFRRPDRVGDGVFADTIYGYTDDGMLDHVTQGGWTATVTGRDWNTGTPTDVLRPDGTLYHQRLNDQGQVTQQFGAGTFARTYDYDPATGQLAGLTTFASGTVGGGGAATTAWDYYDPTGQFKDKTYAGEATPAIGNTYKDGGPLDQRTLGGQVGTAGQNTVGEADSWSIGDLTQSVLRRDVKGRPLTTRQTSALPGGTGGTLAVAPHVTYDDADRLETESVGHVPDAKVRYAYYAADDAAPTAAPGALESVRLERDGVTIWSATYLYDPQTKRLRDVVVRSGTGAEASERTFTYGYKPGTDLVWSLGSDGKLAADREYDGLGRLAFVGNAASAGGGYDVDYALTDNDQRERATVVRTNPDGTSSQFYWKYDYDQATADQLKSANAFTSDGDGDDANDAPLPGRQFAYAFDGIGNRTDRAYAPNAANQYTANPDAGGATIQYDARGNLTNDGAFAYTYDGADRLTSATPNSPATGAYKMEAGYDDQGRRIWKRSYQYDGQQWQRTGYRKFVYDGWNLIAEFEQDPATGLDKLFRTYAWGQDLGGGVGGLLSITTYQADGATPDQTYLPMFDGSGNVVGLVDAATGGVAATYEYDPFGNLLDARGDAAALDANPFRFSTKYFDAESGLYYYGMRYYSPQLGRWVTRDPLQEAGGVNLYAFVGNDPVNNIDADGLSAVPADLMERRASIEKDLGRGLTPAEWSFLLTAHSTGQGWPVTTESLKAANRLSQLLSQQPAQQWPVTPAAPGNIRAAAPAGAWRTAMQWLRNFDNAVLDRVNAAANITIAVGTVADPRAQYAYWTTGEKARPPQVRLHLEDDYHADVLADDHQRQIGTAIDVGLLLSGVNAANSFVATRGALPLEAWAARNLGSVPPVTIGISGPGTKWGHLSAAERQALIAEKVEANAQRWLTRLEGRSVGFGNNGSVSTAHFLAKHSPMTTWWDQAGRSLSGRINGLTGQAADSSRFYRYTDMMHAIDRAMASGQSGYVIITFESPIGGGFYKWKKFSSFRFAESAEAHVFIHDATRLPMTAFPKLPPP